MLTHKSVEAKIKALDVLIQDCEEFVTSGKPFLDGAFSTLARAGYVRQYYNILILNKGKNHAADLVSTALGKGPGFARLVASFANEFEKTRDIKPSCQGLNAKKKSLINDEDARQQMQLQWIRCDPHGQGLPAPGFHKLSLCGLRNGFVS